MTDDSALFSLPQQQQLCPLCQQPLVMKSGKNGPFLGCSAYPACHYIKALHQHETAIVKVLETDSKGLLVLPEGAKVELQIKKSQIAINAADARPNRFIKNDRIDAAIQELDLKKRKVSLSIKLLEEIQNKEAVSKFSSPLSGKNLPFSSLSDKLEKKENKKKKE